VVKAEFKCPYDFTLQKEEVSLGYKHIEVGVQQTVHIDESRFHSLVQLAGKQQACDSEEYSARGSLLVGSAVLEKAVRDVHREEECLKSPAFPLVQALYQDDHSRTLVVGYPQTILVALYVVTDRVFFILHCLEYRSRVFWSELPIRSYVFDVDCRQLVSLNDLQSLLHYSIRARLYRLLACRCV